MQPTDEHQRQPYVGVCWPNSGSPTHAATVTASFPRLRRNRSISLDLRRQESDECHDAKENHRVPRQENQTNFNGFAIPLRPDTDLGHAMLIAEDDEGNYAPICVVSTLREAQEMAESDFRSRLRLTERGAEAGLAPVRYKVWARGIGGEYRTAIEIAAWHNELVR